jgi:ribosomal-protein-alanine N-acetyltransferase
LLRWLSISTSFCGLWEPVGRSNIRDSCAVEAGPDSLRVGDCVSGAQFAVPNFSESRAVDDIDMITDFAIELAAASDAIDIASMSRTQIEHGLPWGWTPARVMHSVREPATNVAVARQAGRLVGFGIMKYFDEGAHLLLFAVSPKLRRAGIGSSLLEWLEDVARVAGVVTVSAEVRADNIVGRAFYRAHGYCETAAVPRMYHGRLDGVRLAKRLYDHLPDPL